MEKREYQYRDTLIGAVILLEKIGKRLFTAIVNPGMYGVYSKVHQVLDVGDHMDFELPMFEDSGDVSLDKLVNLLKQVSDSRESIMNFNAIREGGIE